jgi:hypothetical protein
MKTLSKIIKTNFKRRGKNILAISMSLLDVLLEKSPMEMRLVELNKLMDHSGFVPMSLIPADVQEFLALDAIENENNTSDALASDTRGGEDSNSRFMDFSVVINAHNSRLKSLRLENLEKAFNEYKDRECEFIDSFLDEVDVKKRAQRLSVLLYLRREHYDSDFLEKAYKRLRELDPNFDLVSGSLQDFYEQLRWYARAGEVKGCIHN